LTSNKYSYSDFSTIMGAAFAEFRASLGSVLFHYLLPAIFIVSIVLYLLLRFKILSEFGIEAGLDMTDFRTKSFTFGAALILLTNYLFVLLIMISSRESLNLQNKLKATKTYFLKTLPISIIFSLGYFYVQNAFMWLLLMVIPIHFLFILLENIATDKKLGIGRIGELFKFSFQRWFDFLPISLGLYSFIIAMALLFLTGLLNIFVQFISWHDIFGNYIADRVLVKQVLSFVCFSLPIPLMYFAYTYRYASSDCLVNATDLNKKLENFGVEKSMLEVS